MYVCMCMCVAFKHGVWCTHFCALSAADECGTRQFSSIRNVPRDVIADRLWSHLATSAARWRRCWHRATDWERSTIDQQLVIRGGENHSRPTFGHWQLHQHIWSGSPIFITTTRTFPCLFRLRTSHTCWYMGQMASSSILLCLQPAPMQPVKLFDSIVHCPLATQLSSLEFCWLVLSPGVHGTCQMLLIPCSPHLPKTWLVEVTLVSL